MDKRRLSAVYTIIVGCLMLAMWGMLVFTNQVPYLNTPQLEIKLHILTETLTAMLLILGGVTVLRNWNHTEIHYVSQGMLIYAVINSSGYYIDLGELGMVIMFGALLVCTVCSILVYASSD